MKKILLTLIFVITLSGQSYLPLWDYEAICDETTLDAETLWVCDTSYVSLLSFDFINLKVGEVRFNSFGADSGTLRIQAFFACPIDRDSLTGMVINHGMLMDGDLDMAMKFSAALGVYTIAISAPGHGESTGGSAYFFPNLVEAYPEPRNNYFFQYAWAAMRAVTFMQHTSVIDTSWLTMLGFSAGGVATQLANGIDERLKFCVPVIPQTNFQCGIDDSSWMINLMSEAGVDLDGPDGENLQEYIAPFNYMPYFNAYTYYVVGSLDEIEPLDCIYGSLSLIDDDSYRLDIVPNFDHHSYYADSDLIGMYDSYDNSYAFYLRLIGGAYSLLEMLKLGTPTPDKPTMDIDCDDGTFSVTSHVNMFFELSNDVMLWYSTDSAWTYQSVEMTRTLGDYEVTLELGSEYTMDNVIMFVEAFGYPYLYMSSLPYAPSELRLNIRPIPDYFIEMDVEESNLPEYIEIKAYPNPFNSQISVDMQTEAQVKIIDINGKIVWSSGGKIKNLRWRPKPDLSTGIYFIIISNDDIRVSKKIELIR